MALSRVHHTAALVAAVLSMSLRAEPRELSFMTAVSVVKAPCIDGSLAQDARKKGVAYRAREVATDHGSGVCTADGRALFNGKDLSGWYTFLKGRGRNKDPKGVFSVKDGVIRITGEEFGSLITEEEFGDYHLSLEYRFTGGRQFPPKVGFAPDSGLLFHSTGPDGGYYGIWMESLEVNIIKGATGDFWGVGVRNSDRFSLSARVGKEKLGGRYAIHDPDGTSVFTIRGNKRVCRMDIARDWRDTNTVAIAVNENAFGKWNRVDLRCAGDTAVVEVNGKTVNRGFGIRPRKGRIQLQSEGCGIEFRNIVIRPYRGR